MKSPQGLTFIVAVVFAVIAYILSTVIGSSPEITAILVLVSTFIAPLIGSSTTAESADEEIKTLYVGNLPYRANESSIRELFSEHGQVHSVRLMKDKHTGKRRGFGFVEMSADAADAAVSSLNDTEFQQRTLKVREAKERPEKNLEEE
ncbi:RNA-binding protein [Colwellia sp. PAMC 20917]|jgi:RNA recognition motif-containing protein|uniref:RNA recognition motif domain-containing protein n=1 Tax=unclassified Colwellia TaxID=196834 RepID=UPI0008790068|nr:MULTISPECIES: RNA-binding protein [unclassified Colwellia]MBA6365006.1 RNA-binding protein [Colwellia sp. BRX8-8]AOW77525.1 RNA-binding protein [Colwellia sp. PAMC 20917]MBA6348426.1 RNA-binding protein [Colwellia sp. BRX8-9]MBA6352273.1 RNA-binding protein [Colwellia sp. BRX9-1]MBA6355940.1 RNA-binding protein [Colwellia sp. BRX8-3]|tara:strand:- start:4473 stop:4916 length:444 start_codon:yes stop_codon:yes gene_type:complete